jgi:hypothetical protein
LLKISPTVVHRTVDGRDGAFTSSASSRDAGAGAAPATAADWTCREDAGGYAAAAALRQRREIARRIERRDLTPGPDNLGLLRELAGFRDKRP